MSSTPDYCKFEDADPAALVLAASRVLEQEGSHKARLFDAGFWRWQYRDLPEGESHVYVARDGGRILGYYHVPVYNATAHGNARRFAVVQDVAISPELRGRGAFRRLSEFANADLAARGVDAIYTFPNTKSIGTFLKYCGYRRVGRLSSAVLLLDSASILRTRSALSPLAGVVGPLLDGVCAPWGRGSRMSGDVVPHRSPDADFLGPYADAASSWRPLHLARSEAYLRWRFQERPSSDYRFLSLRVGRETMASIVLKSDRMFSLPVLILMDYAHLKGEEGALLDLLRFGTRGVLSSESERPAAVFASGAGDAMSTLWRAGFLPVPALADPRPLNLLVKDLSKDGIPGLGQMRDWHLTLADWDVF